jgi:hypothetical protein
MSRRVYLLGVGLALLALAFVVTDRVFGPPPGITEVNARRLRWGMTLAQVEAIFGCPANGRIEFTPILRGGAAWEGREEPDPTLGWVREWDGRGGTATVFFYRDNRVHRVQFDSSAQSAVMEHFRAWLGW